MFYLHFVVWAIGLIARFFCDPVAEGQTGLRSSLKVFLFPCLPLITIYLTSREVLIFSLRDLQSPNWTLEYSYFSIFFLGYVLLALLYFYSQLQRRERPNEYFRWAEGVFKSEHFLGRNMVLVLFARNVLQAAALVLAEGSLHKISYLVGLYTLYLAYLLVVRPLRDRFLMLQHFLSEFQIALIHAAYFFIIRSPEEVVRLSEWLVIQIIVLFASYLLLSVISLVINLCRLYRYCRSQKKVQPVVINQQQSKQGQFILRQKTLPGRTGELATKPAVTRVPLSLRQQLEKLEGPKNSSRNRQAIGVINDDDLASPDLSAFRNSDSRIDLDRDPRTDPKKYLVRIEEDTLKKLDASRLEGSMSFEQEGSFQQFNRGNPKRVLIFDDDDDDDEDQDQD